MVTADHQTLVEALIIFNTSLIHPGLLSYDVIRHDMRFLAQGKIPTMMFGLPGAATAMYHYERPEHKEHVNAIMLAGDLASFTTGITEPLEFCFIFISSILFIFHALLSGVGLC